jgi:hypothetical protein
MTQSLKDFYDFRKLAARYFAEYCRDYRFTALMQSHSTYTAYKLFEEKNGMPRSLVHGMPTEDGRRSCMFLLDEWIDSETGKPGFNCFEDPRALLKYYPRFRVRADRLVACRVYVSIPNVPRIGDNYQKYYKMIIYSDDWHNRISPIALGINIMYQEQYQTWVNEYEQRSNHL